MSDCSNLETIKNKMKNENITNNGIYYTKYNKCMGVKRDDR